MKQLLILTAAIMPLLAGCLSCEPLLEVRNCHEHQCEPSKDAVHHNWTAEDGAAWPVVDKILRDTVRGEHAHHHWTEAEENQFWADYGVTGDQRELIVSLGDDTFRIRILTCQ